MFSIFYDVEDSSFIAGNQQSEASWLAFMKDNTPLLGANVLDIGCGNGTFSQLMAIGGAQMVTGLDYSIPSLLGALNRTGRTINLQFVQGDARDIQFCENTFDLVVMRAMLHQMTTLSEWIDEAFRVLKPNGTIVIQDRTPEDVLAKGNQRHFNGYLFEQFPQLAEQDILHHTSSQDVQTTLRGSGFVCVQELPYWEPVRVYHGVEAVRLELKKRAMECSDSSWIDEMCMKFNNDTYITEMIPWTFWTAQVG